MKKRILSIFLVLIMLIQMLPMNVSAAVKDVTLFSSSSAQWPSTTVPVYISSLVLQGTDVKQYNWDGNDCYVTLNSGTSDNASFTLKLAATARQQQMLGMLSGTANGAPLSFGFGGTASYTGTLVNGKADVPVKINVNNISMTKSLHISVDGISDVVFHDVTLTEGEGYTLSADSKSVKNGDNYTFSVTVKDSHQGVPVVKANDVTLENPTVNGNVYTYTISNVTAAQTITVSNVEPKPTHAITMNGGDGYSIVAASGNSSPVVEGKSYTFIVTVKETHTGTPMVKTNGMELTASAMSGGSYTYTISNITAAQDITVEGVEPKPTYTVMLPSGTGYTVAAMPDSNSPVVEGKNYTFSVTVLGAYEGTPIIKANGTALDAVKTEGKVYTYTVENITQNQVITVEGISKITSASELQINYVTTSGSMDSAIFLDGEDRPIEGVVAYVESNNIYVELPLGYPVNGTVKTEFTLTQNDSGRPILSLKNGTTGVSSDRWNNSSNIFTKKATTLNNGRGSLTFYYCNGNPDARKWTLNYEVYNNLPALADRSNTSEEKTLTVGDKFELNLGNLFTDIDGQTLTYKVSVNDGAFTDVGVDYSYTPELAGTYTLKFKANDGMDDSEEVYTVTLTVENSTDTYDMTVSVPEALQPKFYVLNGFGSDNTDVPGDMVATVKGATADGMTTYTLTYPQNATMLSVRADGWGGMAFAAKENGTVSLRQLQTNVVDYENNAAECTVTVKYDAHTAVGGENGWLLVSGQTYAVSAVPADSATLATVTENIVLTDGAEILVHKLMLEIKNPVTITAPTGATAQLYSGQNWHYYDYEKIDAKIVKDNGDGTTTHSYIADTTNGTYFYRVAMEGKITKAGWLKWSEKSVRVAYSDTDKSPDYRLDDYYSTGVLGTSFASEDSVLLNINSRNHLHLDVDATKTLKAYRAWEIVSDQTNNHIITPDFDYTVLSGQDVVSLEDKESESVGEGDWKTLKSEKNGVAIIEVTYDAIDVGSSDKNKLIGVYGASDPDRTGLVVVQVGEADDPSVKFGIEGFSSKGIATGNNQSGGTITYNPNSKMEWDAEFDTLYFTGDSGEMKLQPTADSAITEVAVSHDKGASWVVLNGMDGVYTAKIVSGNNILRVKTASGTAYQVVRGDKITYSVREVDGKSDKDGEIEVGETVRITLDGLHIPIPKMSGNYNPGGRNIMGDDKYTKPQLTYDSNGERIYGAAPEQYAFIARNNSIEVEIPESGIVELTDGYIGIGEIGLDFTSGNSHRNMPEGGFGTRGSSTHVYTLCLLPDITVSVGGTAAENSAPVVRADAVTQAEIYHDQKYSVNPELLFRDPDGDTLSFTVSVNGAEAQSATTAYKFTPDGVGEYSLTFTASDGKETVQHTLIVKVTQRSTEEEKELDFGLSAEQIAGYVKISFEDNGVRVPGETGLKYPVPLGTIIEAVDVPFVEGENIAHVTKRLLDAMKIGFAFTGTLEEGFYLTAIYNFEVDGTPYDSLAALDAGSGSGWMISQNDMFIDKGTSDFKVKSGDVICWQYTCQLGADIGGIFNADVNRVIELIDGIGMVTLDSRAKIEEAREAYDALEDKAAVTNYDVLTAAESELAKLLKEQADAVDKVAAEVVEEKIAALGTVSLESEEKIKAVREAYEKLTAEQKVLVENLHALQAAEEKLALLKLAGTDITKIYTETGDYLEGLSAPGVGTQNGEWRVIGLSRAGKSVADSYYNAVVKFVQENIDENGRLHESKSTDNSRLIVALTAIGKDVTDVSGYDLLSGLNDMTYIGKQGINGTIWALIAFDTHNYDIPDGDVTREKLVSAILGKQNADGGWSLSGSTSDPDMTGMALQALAPYYGSNSDSKKAVDKAVAWLSGVQNKDGTFTGSEGTTAESLAQVITALTALGINPETDSRFVKNGVSAVDALSKFFVEGGGFKHGLSGERNTMATEQGYYALVSYFRLLQEKTSLYDMSDVTVVVPVYKIIEGANSDWQKDDAALTIRADGEFAKFTGVKIDGTLVDSKHYTAKAGSTVITFKADYLKTLSEGEHTITVTFEDGEASTSVSILPSDEEVAKKIVDAIDAIGMVTENSGDKIKAARKAYDALTTEQKKLVTNYKVLTDAESTYDLLVSKISVTFTLLGCYEHDSDTVHTLSGGDLSIWIAKKTYKVESGATVKDVLEKALAEAGMSYRNPTGNYVESINGIGEFTNGSLSGWMYTLNGVHPGLGVAEQTVQDGDVIVFHYTDDYTKESDNTQYGDAQAAKFVEQMIDKLDPSSKSFESDVTAAKAAYDALTAEQKKLVKNYSKLTDAMKSLADEKDVKAAEEVEKLIDAIGTVTKDSKEAIEAAREAYDKLSAEQKALVENILLLETAEERLEKLMKAGAAEDIYKQTGDYLESLGTPGVGSIGGEWMVIGLIRSGREIEDVDAYYDAVLQFVEENIDENGRLHKAKSSENARLILALTALGKDVTNVGGHDLLKGLGNMQYVKTQGINGPIWTLIALDSGNYPVPEGDVSRDALLMTILNAQLSDGGWALSGTASDPDMTGMALQALAPYYEENADVKAAVDRALQAISDMQTADGAFASIDGKCAESAAQVLAALSALGIDANTDVRFIKNGVSVLDALCAFFVKDGGFSHIPDGDLDGMATEQAYYALTAYFRMLNGEYSLFDMTDIIDMGGDIEAEEPKVETEEEAEAETVPAVTEPMDAPEKADFPWWILIIAVVVIAAGSVLVVWIPVMKKKNK